MAALAAAAPRLRLPRRLLLRQRLVLAPVVLLVAQIPELASQGPLDRAAPWRDDGYWDEAPERLLGDKPKSSCPFTVPQDVRPLNSSVPLKVFIVSGRNFQKKLNGAPADVWIQYDLRVGGGGPLYQNASTGVARDPSPSWDHVCIFPVPESADNDTITISAVAFDYNSGRSEKYGEFQVDVDYGARVNLEFPLRDCQPICQHHTDITVRVKTVWADPSDWKTYRGVDDRRNRGVPEWMWLVGGLGVLVLILIALGVACASRQPSKQQPPPPPPLPPPYQGPPPPAQVEITNYYKQTDFGLPPPQRPVQGGVARLHSAPAGASAPLVRGPGQEMSMPPLWGQVAERRAAAGAGDHYTVAPYASEPVGVGARDVQGQPAGSWPQGQPPGPVAYVGPQDPITGATRVRLTGPPGTAPSKVRIEVSRQQ